MFLLFIYLLFTLAMLSLRCYAQGFFGAAGGGWGWDILQSWCLGFSWLSCLRTQAFGDTGFNSCGSQAPEHWLCRCDIQAQLPYRRVGYFQTQRLNLCPPEFNQIVNPLNPRDPPISDVERLSKVYGYNMVGRELI